MLKRMHSRSTNNRLPVRSFQPDIIGRDRIAAQMIDPARKNSGHDARMVYRKALYKFHQTASLV